MKRILFCLFFSALPLFALEEVRLDNKSTTDTHYNGFQRVEVWKFDKVTNVKDDYYYQFDFFGKVTVSKILISSPDVNIPELATYPVPGMYNFEIQTRAPKSGEWKSWKKFTRNSARELKVEDKVLCDGLKIKVTPVASNINGGDVYYGEFKHIMVWGYEGDVMPKQERLFNYKDEIRTKEDAKKAFNNKELTAQEYLELLKKLPD
jgi:hypothetical protein